MICGTEHRTGRGARERDKTKVGILLASLLIVLTSLVARAQPRTGVAVVPVRTIMKELLADEDTDHDLKITVNDSSVSGTRRGDKKFSFLSIDHVQYEVAGTYYLSNLLQELRILEEAGRDTAALRLDRVFEQPVDRISRSIREQYWNALTRRIDVTGLPAILRDDKTSTMDGKRYLYVPASDPFAFEYFDSLSHQRADWNLQVVQLPAHATAEYMRSLNRVAGILSLAYTRVSADSLRGVPFVVPGGRFNEMYGWDSYFIVLGLLQDGRVDLAKSIVDNFVYEIRNYGAVLNANRTYYLTRSQPPFLSSMALEVYGRLAKDSLSLLWLRTVFKAVIQEYRTVWMNADHLTQTGLSRYFDRGLGPPPEVEPGHFNSVFARFADRRGMDVVNYERDYTLGLLKEPELDQFFEHDRAMRESGHDTSYRLYNRCADLVTVDLNSLLYKIEKDVADVLNHHFGGLLVLDDSTTEKSADWVARAAKRKELINQYLWDPGHGMFFDYDFRKGERVPYVSATTFYPLWAGLATKAQAMALVERALPQLEMPGGVVSSTEDSRGAITPNRPLRQWDYPYGWAPHQILVWQGLKNYGFVEQAERLAYRWLYMITSNATKYNGTITEKYDVVRRSHDVFAEYGNVGTKFSYITKEGFGWTNASYQVGLGLLGREHRIQLNELIPPEEVFSHDK